MKLTHTTHSPGFSKLIEEVFGNYSSTNSLSETNSATPLANIYEKEESHKIELVLPGFNKEDIKIELKDSLLTVSTEKHPTELHSDEKLIRKEFTSSSLSRSFRLPKLIDIENIEAKHENGILSIVIPKKEEEIKKNKLIEIA